MFLYQLVCVCLLVYACMHLFSTQEALQAGDNLVLMDHTPKRVTSNVRMCLMPGEFTREMWFNWGTIRIYPTGHLLQKHYTGKMFRLIDQRFLELTRGTEADCQVYLAEKELLNSKSKFSKHVVILIHGLYAPGWCMRHFQPSLNTDGRQAFMVDYPSSRVTLEECAKYLKQALASLENVDQIDLVCHSMGGVVARQYLMDYPDPRVKTLVTLGTPHKGAELASMFQGWPMFDKFIGPAGKQLASDVNSAVNQLPFPKIPVGVIAGGTGTSRGYNPLIKGDNDGTVSIASANIEQATDYMQVKAMHHYLLRKTEVIQAVDRFLKTQSFNSVEKREKAS